MYHLGIATRVELESTMMRTDMQEAASRIRHQPASYCRGNPGSYFFEERVWRNVTSPADEIMVSRWLDVRTTSRTEEAVTPTNCYFFGVALKTTRLKLTAEHRTIFEGIMPEGTLYVSAPSRRLAARFDAPCDFLHFHVAATYFTAPKDMEHVLPTEDLNGLVLLRDELAARLAKTLLGRGERVDETFARCIGQTLALRLALLEPPRAKARALPKWRLRRVEDHVNRNLHRSIRLADLAQVAGLSRMHFAKQFRAATGYRPHEYLLHQRIEQAKSLLLETKSPLVEIALAVGFCTQAHFSTVFKHITGETPARWRCASQN